MKGRADGRENIKKDRFGTRDLVYIAVFAASWGVVEAVLGSVIKTLNVPFGGLIMSVVAAFILVVSRAFLNFFGAQITIGIITALLKVFISINSIIIGPVIAMLAEAVLFDVVITLVGFSRRGAAVAGAMPPVWSFAQPFITYPLLFGLPLSEYYAQLLRLIGSPLGLGDDALVWVLLLAIAIYAVAGVAGGLVGWGTSWYLKSITAR